MSFLNEEKMQNAQKTNLDLLQQMNAKIFDGMEQLFQLNVSTARTAVDAGFANCHKLLSVRDPQGFADTQGSMLNPSEQLKQMMEYSRQIYDVCSSTQAGVASLVEQQIAASTQQMQEIVEDMARNVPAGAEPMVGAFKSAIDGANSVYENTYKASRKAQDMAESSMASMAAATRQAAQNASEATSKATPA